MEVRSTRVEKLDNLVIFPVSKDVEVVIGVVYYWDWDKMIEEFPKERRSHLFTETPMTNFIPQRSSITSFDYFD